MLPRVRWGLIVGAGVLLLNVGVSLALGCCGPLVSLIGGALAAFLAVRDEGISVRKEASSVGAIAGVVAGGVGFVGQMIGGLIALAIGASNPQYLEMFGMQGTGSEMAGYWAGGIGAGVCFGLIGVGLAAGAGALTAYLMVKEESA